MADIERKQSHNVDLAVLRTRLDELADELKTKFGVKYKWDGDTCLLSGAALKKGFLTMSAGELTLELTLGMMGKMVKGQIEKEIDARIEKIIA